MWSISTLHVGPDQPDPRPIPNPNPNPNPKTDPLGGSRSAGAATRLRRVFWWRFSKKLRRPESQPRSIRPAPCTKFCADQSCTYDRASRPRLGFVAETGSFATIDALSAIFLLFALLPSSFSPPLDYADMFLFFVLLRPCSNHLLLFSKYEYIRVLPVSFVFRLISGFLLFYLFYIFSYIRIHIYSYLVLFFLRVFVVLSYPVRGWHLICLLVSI